mgnify:CR=1 FL=1
MGPASSLLPKSQASRRPGPRQKCYQTAQDKAHAENKIMGIPSSMKVSEYTSMRMSYERAHGKIPDARLPGVTLLERLEAETEEGEFIAPHLNEIPSKEK